MGICSSIKLKKEVDKRGDLDFEYFRESLKDSSEKLFEVKAKLWEVETTKQTIKKTLISKYLYFHSDGKFLSRFKKMNSPDEILLDGYLEKGGAIKMTLQEKILNNNLTKLKTFEGNICQNDDKGLQFSGNIVEKINGNENKINTFVLDFTNVLWILHSETGKTNVFQYNKDSYFIGISHDEKGYSIWNGLEKADNNVIIVRRYFNYDSSDKKEDDFVTYHGVFDKLEHFIGGEIISKRLEKMGQFKLQRLSKPYRKKKKN